MSGQESAPHLPNGKDMAQTFSHFINGAFVSGASGDTFTRTNPADDRDTIGDFPDGGDADIAAAVSAAKTALPAWRKLSPDSRAAFLFRAADILERRKSEMAAALTREEGKSLAEATGETGRGVVLLRYYAGEGLRVGGDVIPSVNPNALFFTERVPVGVVGLITPWNFPIAIPVWKAAPALVYGNTVVLKPSEMSPVTAHILAEVLAEAGLPAGVFNVVHGRGANAGAALVAHPDVNAVSFTGSGNTGKKIAAVCAGRGAKYQLEMGGKNPAIVLEDADMAQAVELVVQGAMKSAGEKCTATSRAIVVESVADEFTARIVERVKGLKITPGTDPSGYLGPVISGDSKARILSFVAAAKDSGAKVLTGGESPTDPELANGHYVQPTVITGVSPDSPIAQEEVFGPVLTILRVPDFDNAIEVANRVAYGLSASLFTANLGNALRFAREMDAGLVRVNGETAGVEPQAPFGGMKGSSSWSREQGQAAKEFYTQLKTISFERAG